MKNNTKVYGEGYIAGYNQCRVDRGFLTQENADAILRKIRSEDESECGHEAKEQDCGCNWLEGEGCDSCPDEPVGAMANSYPKKIERLQLPLDMREYYNWDSLSIEDKIEQLYAAVTDIANHTSKLLESKSNELKSTRKAINNIERTENV